MMTVTELLSQLDLERYASVFIENEIDFQTLGILTDADLKELGLPFGPRKRLLSAMAERQAEPIRPPAPSERRQVTVLFCDMVSFTELAHRVDPEVLERIVRIYEDSCAQCITRYDGYVFQRLGDGVVAFFGFPHAHEGEAERAIRAALEILQAMEHTDDPEAGGRIHVRIGIATGIVVVSSAENRAVGETMTLAARLQSLADRDMIVVSERVQRLASGAFVYLDLGEHDLKGIRRRTRAYGVVGISSAETRFDATAGPALTRLVGRQSEFRALRRCWEIAESGSGNAVLLSGDAGIGKSRMLSALCEILQPGKARVLRLQCSPFFASSAFHPITTALVRALALDGEKSADEKLNKLETLLAGSDHPGTDVCLIAAMFSIPFESRYGPLNMSPRRIKAETSRLLVDTVAQAVGQRPGLLLVEDLHWADPSTVEVLNTLIEQLSSLPLLVVLTHRPEFDSPWPESHHVSHLRLSRLSEAESRELVVSSAGGKELPPELVRQIVMKADGVPLFVEELTRAMIASGSLVEEEHRYRYRNIFSNVSLPETLRDSLAARLDGVPAAKQIAQVGAVVGREFSFQMLAALELMPETALERGLTVLTDSGLVSRDADTSRGMYTFSHALVQDAAYESLLKSERHPLHRRIASVIGKRWPETADTHPELLAHHYTAAGDSRTAIPFWHRAGDAARKAFALTEAATHLRRGLELLDEVAPGVDRDHMETGLRMTLAPTIIAQSGWANRDVSSILEPAWMIAESRRHYPAYLPILSALSVHYMCLGELRTALTWAEKLLEAGTVTGDDTLSIVGHRAASACYYWAGEFLAARRHGDVLQSTLR